jgi:hypothetical protein
LQQIVRLHERNVFEDDLATKVAQSFTQNAVPLNDKQSLEYIVGTNSCSIDTILLSDRGQQIVPINSRPAKHMPSLKPTTIHKPVSQLKEEMMKGYGGEGYCFLEEHINGMMKNGSWTIRA